MNNQMKFGYIKTARESAKTGVDALLMVLNGYPVIDPVMLSAALERLENATAIIRDIQNNNDNSN